jgi:DNA polymerase-4
MRHILWLEWEGFYAAEGAGAVAVVRDKTVLDVSQAAKRMGVRPGMDVPQLRSLAPDCRMHDWHAEEYAERQRAWLDICAEFTGILEPIDQHIAALDLTDHPNRLDITDRLIRDLVKAVRRPLKYGSAPSKWIAKLAALGNDLGGAVQYPEAFLAPLPVACLLPVEEAHRQRLEFLGYRSIGDVAGIPGDILRDQFGEAGLTIAQAARGGQYEPVRALYPLNSLRECFFFESPVEDWQALGAAISLLADRIDRRIEGLQSSNVELSIESEDGTVDVYARRFTKPIHNRLSAVAALRLLLDAWNASLSPLEEPGGVPPVASPSLAGGSGPIAVAALRVTLTELEPLRQRQRPLFDARVRPAAEAAVRYVQNTFGEGAIRLGSTIELPRRELVLREWRRATGWH